VDPTVPAWRSRVRFPRAAAFIALLLAFTASPARAQTAADSAVRALVLRANPELAAARASVLAAQARVGATGFAPPLTLSAEAEEIPGGIDLTGAGSLRVEVGHEFLSGRRRRAARALAATGVTGAEAALAGAERRVLADAERALARAAGWSAIARRLAAEDSLLAGAEEALRARFSVGEARYVDVLRLRTERLRIQTERAEALAEARAGRRVLEALAGSADTAGLAPVIDAAIAERGARLVTALPGAPAVEPLVAGSPAVRRAEAVLAAARAERQLLAAQQRPRVTASAGVQRFGGDAEGHAVGPTLGASVTLPSTARRANRAALAAADARIAAAAAERDAVLAGVRAEGVAAAERYEAARTRLATFDAALLRGAREEREAALAAYRTGGLSLVELIDFERALARAEMERLGAALDAADALRDLLASGSGTEGAGIPNRTNDDDR
jgi:cobalt-zinc-cadmium efflux system outer membrane protein